MTDVIYTGGCQCGAVRFRIRGELGRPSICHCRMCQKAFGSFFGPLVSANGLRWTRGEPKRFASSNLIRRGFCADCGTPLTYERARSPKMVNIPRALFSSRTGREPRYHVALQEQADWTYAGEPLAPLKGYPGVMWARPKRRPPPRDIDGMF